ncbi:hypothetical protein [Rhodococcus sp. 311R]|uniref:hypothetical protein n=1 Tax=Rhodococcus sp. 311R TaxID=1617904 RepID=UPI00067EA3FF|nr:hypothetical protein [Rhodococcus sp. 311R]
MIEVKIEFDPGDHTIRACISWRWTEEVDSDISPDPQEWLENSSVICQSTIQAAFHFSWVKNIPVKCVSVEPGNSGYGEIVGQVDLPDTVTDVGMIETVCTNAVSETVALHRAFDAL